ncbi:hypothetical protein CRYPA_394 [uncultured Candidatus Thioglobus sp.]|nr:hypothetical protein CRYPA_394 [uncultured Candidatus Thioglobus sp.]
MRKFFYILILLISSASVLADDIFFDEVIASDMSSSILSDSTDMLIAPLILLGKKSGEISVNVRMDMSVASIEVEKLLSVTKRYLKSEIYRQISTIKDDFVLTEELPQSIEVILDELLNVVINLTPEAMKNLTLNVFSNKPKLRTKLKNPINSLINDVNVKFSHQTTSEVDVGVKSALRVNRFLLTGNSVYKNGKMDFFKDNLLLNYEKSNKNYLLGWQRPPRFSGVNSQSLLGLSIGNTALNNYIVLESSRRYVDLIYPANIKVYIGDILHSENDYKSGKHVLDIPLNIEPSIITLKIEDIYGRLESIAFEFAGDFSNNIPQKNQYLYFASIGKDTQNQVRVYAGLEFGLNRLSKISMAANLDNDNQVLGVTHYQLLKKINFENVLSLSKSHKNTGAAFKSKLLLNKLNTYLEFDFKKNFTINNKLQANKKNLLARVRLIPIEKLALNLKVEYKQIDNKTDYSLSSKYKFNKNLSAGFSYEKNDNSTMRFSLDWSFGGQTKVKALFDNQDYKFGVRHDFNDNQAIEVQHYNQGSFVVFEDNSSIFKNKFKVDEKNNKEPIITANSQFSIVSSGLKSALAPVIGNNGFVVFEAGEGLEHNIEVNYANAVCLLKKSDYCAMKLPNDKSILPHYKLDEIGFNEKISGIEEALFVPKKSGITHLIDSVKVYFVQAIMLDNNKPVDLLVGSLIDSKNNKTDVFTDESGQIFAQLGVGKYQLSFPGFKSIDINIRDIDAKEDMINLSEIALIRNTPEAGFSRSPASEFRNH